MTFAGTSGKSVIDITSGSQGWNNSGTLNIYPPNSSDPSGFFDGVNRIFYQITPSSTSNPDSDDGRYLIGGTSDKITLNVTNSHTQYIITWTCSNLVNIKTLTTTVNITWAQLDADDWGWLKGSAASVRERYGNNTSLYRESGLISPGQTFLNRSTFDSIVGGNNGRDGRPDPITFTIGVIIYNFNINTFDNGPHGDGRHLIDISDHSWKYKFGHSLRFRLLNHGGHNYASITVWWQYKIRHTFDFRIGWGGAGQGSGYDWKIIYVSNSANGGRRCAGRVQVSYRQHNTNNSWTSVSCNNPGGFTPYQSDTWSTGDTSGGSSGSSSDSTYPSSRPSRGESGQRLHDHDGLVIGGAGQNEANRRFNHTMRCMVLRDSSWPSTD